MKRAFYIAAVVALALMLPAMGQIRGVPASVTSMAPGRSFTPGPPASVTSLSANGYGHRTDSGHWIPYGYPTNCSAGGISPLIPSALGCTPTQFTSGFYYPDGRDRGPVNLRPKRHHEPISGGYYPVYLPYAYPVAVAAEPEPEAEAEPDPPAPAIFEHRPTSERAPSAVADSQRPERQPAVAAQEYQSPADARQQIPVVLVYRDGHEQEVKNYAIVGPTLYDLGTFVAHKIPLAELNLKATIKANDDRGVEFTVPAWVKME
jgi:hypothetical protein